LTDGWYLLTSPAPPGVGIAFAPSYQSLPDGSVGARLRIGSQLTPRDVQLCAKTTSTEVVHVDFSELLAPDADLAQDCSVQGSGIACDSPVIINNQVTAVISWPEPGSRRA
jgi:hypothetical protein